MHIAYCTMQYAILLMHYGHGIQTDHPTNSKTEPPNLMSIYAKFLPESVAASQTWFAQPVLYGEDKCISSADKTIFDYLAIMQNESREAICKKSSNMQNLKQYAKTQAI